MTRYAKMAALVIAILSLLIVYSIFSFGSDAEVRKAIKTDKPPVVDGILDEAIWKSAPTIAEDFITLTPAFGEIMPKKTTIWIAYDAENLYAAFKCFDNEPDKIKTSTTKEIISGLMILLD